MNIDREIDILLEGFISNFKKNYNNIKKGQQENEIRMRKEMEIRNKNKAEKERQKRIPTEEMYNNAVNTSKQIIRFVKSYNFKYKRILEFYQSDTNLDLKNFKKGIEDTIFLFSFMPWNENNLSEEQLDECDKEIGKIEKMIREKLKGTSFHLIEDDGNYFIKRN